MNREEAKKIFDDARKRRPSDQQSEVIRVEIAKLEIGPTDSLVIKLPLRTAEDRMEFIRQLENHWVGAPKGRIIVLPPSAELQVVKNSTPP